MSRNNKHYGALAHLPEHLQFLMEPSLKFGGHQFPDDIREFASTIDSKDRAELESVAKKLRTGSPMDEINEFLDRYEMTKYPESAKLYFLLDVIDEVVGPAPEPPPKSKKEEIADYVAELQRHGSFRLASRRMMAAMSLGDYGEEAKEAVPLLKKATLDDDVRVRIWSHVALAFIQGERDKHLASLREIHRDYSTRGGDENQTIAINAEAAIEKCESLYLE